MPQEKMILYPQLFWACLALLHTDFVHIYSSALTLLSKVMEKVDLGDPIKSQVLLSCLPISPSKTEALEPGEASGEVPPPFRGLQPLVLKGLTSSVSHGLALEIFIQLLAVPCDTVVGIDGSTRVVLQVVGLLPWLAVLLEKDGDGEGTGLQEGEMKRGMDVAYDLGNYCMGQNCFVRSLLPTFLEVQLFQNPLNLLLPFSGSGQCFLSLLQRTAFFTSGLHLQSNFSSLPNHNARNRHFSNFSSSQAAGKGTYAVPSYYPLHLSLSTGQWGYQSKSSPTPLLCDISLFGIS